MKPGLLLVNLGSPDSPSPSDVRRYLRQFLMDRRVMDLPYFGRLLLVYGCILPFRPKKSAEAYRKIWTAEGSPLVVTGRRVANQLKERLNLPVELAMRYQNPSIEAAIANLRGQQVTHLLLIPLFPHYAMSSYETCVARVKEVLPHRAPEMRLTVAPPYATDPDYIAALVASAASWLRQDYDHLLFSFHGVPKRHLRKTDPTGCHCLRRADCCVTASRAHRTCYRAQCLQTVRAFVEQAQIPKGKYSIAFQSRLGRDPWLTPHTDREILRLTSSGVGKLLVICPAFVADCLETLEEIGIRGRELFLQAGGNEFQLIPCLNAHPAWLKALERIATRHLESWEAQQPLVHLSRK